jgi:hypothetical protein
LEGGSLHCSYSGRTRGIACASRSLWGNEDALRAARPRAGRGETPRTRSVDPLHGTRENRRDDDLRERSRGRALPGAWPATIGSVCRPTSAGRAAELGRRRSRSSGVQQHDGEVAGRVLFPEGSARRAPGAVAANYDDLRNDGRPPRGRRRVVATGGIPATFAAWPPPRKPGSGRVH